MLNRNLFRTSDFWNEFDKLHRDVNRLFYDKHPVARPGFPALNVWSNEDSAIVTAELPGFEANEIDMSVVNDNFTIQGEKKPVEHDDDDILHRQECRTGRFQRSLKIPFKVNVEEVSAKFNNGILKVTLPRAEEDKPRKIAIKVV
jgi:HSP20 family protein